MQHLQQSQEDQKLNYKELVYLLSGLVIGVGFAFIFDPIQGHRRRVLLRDQLVHWRNELFYLSRKRARDLSHRAQGLKAKTLAKLRPEADVDDEILVERVRADVGRKVSHMRSLKVDAKNGIVTLSGLILSDEVDDLLQATKKVPGVKHLINHLNIQRLAIET